MAANIASKLQLLLLFSGLIGKMTGAHSYACTSMVKPYLYQSLPDRLHYLAVEEPERLAFIFYDIDGKRTAVSRKEVYEKSQSLAKSFYLLGIRKGTPVAICMNNSLNALYTIYGVSLAGGILNPVATNLKDGSDITDTMNDMKAEYLVIDASVSDPNWCILNDVWPADQHRATKIPSLKKVICNGSSFNNAVGRLHLSDLLKESLSEKIVLPTVYPEDTLVCFSTSGSTGKPKSVVCSHFSILNWSKQSAVRISNISNGTIYFCDRQFSWTVGFPRFYLAVGCTRVFIDTRMSLYGKNVELVCDIIEKEKVEVAYMPGYLATDVVNHPEYSSKFKDVKAMFVSGERFSLTFLPLKDTFCKKLVVWYGNTEGGGFSTFQSDISEDYEEGIIGLPVPGGEMKIVNEEGHVVPIGTSGELCLRSTWRFSGYEGMPELYDAVMDSSGWFHTGDIAHVRGDGNFVADGRAKEMISMQTFKYFPWDIEKTLKKCPGAKHALAIGVPDPRLNQVVCACIVPEPGINLTDETIKQFCDDTFLENATSAGLSLKPKYCLVFDELPLTPSGKVDRRRLGFLAKDKLGL